jgi:hypothetical protein
MDESGPLRLLPRSYRDLVRRPTETWDDKLMTHGTRIYNLTIGRTWHVMIVWANSPCRLHAVSQAFRLAHQFGRAALRRVFQPGSRGSLTVLPNTSGPGTETASRRQQELSTVTPDLPS